MLHKHLTNVHTYSLNSQTVLLHVYGNSNSYVSKSFREMKCLVQSPIVIKWNSQHFNLRSDNIRGFWTLGEEVVSLNPYSES